MQFDDGGCYAKIRNPWSGINSKTSIGEAKASVFSWVFNQTLSLQKYDWRSDTPLESGNGFCEILEATAICQHETKGVSKARKTQ